VRLGVLILPDRSWRENAVKWRAVEELGFDSAWTYDHLWWRGLSDGDWFAATPVLSAAAAVTTRIAVGVLVATPNLRHPTVLAKEAVTVDDISGGRFVLGLGAGSAGAGDADAVDPTVLTRTSRADRFAEFVELTGKLLTEPATTYRGRFYTAENVRMSPRRQVPLAVAASGPRGLDLVARHAHTWVTMGPTDWSRDYTPDECVAVVATQSELCRRACDRAGRDFAELERIFVTTGWAGDPLRGPDACLELAERYAKVGITHLVVHWPRPSGVYAGDPAMLTEIAATALPRIHEL
jgi:alkanesulfonate monooxygenase SsuD/methylene tetrahydromethanopterin reductase-like flavin-dependent oxidoreductase (luciferase family)